MPGIETVINAWNRCCAASALTKEPQGFGQLHFKVLNPFKLFRTRYRSRREGVDDVAHGLIVVRGFRDHEPASVIVANLVISDTQAEFRDTALV